MTERNRRRSLLEVLEFARDGEDGVTNIESRSTVVTAVNFPIEKRVRRQIVEVMKKQGEDFVELISGDYFVYDLTAKLPRHYCSIGICENTGQILETRLIFAYDEKDQEYTLGEFSPEVRAILQKTRKRAAICEDDLLEAQIKGTTLEIYQRIPQFGPLADVVGIDQGISGAALPQKSRRPRHSPKLDNVVNIFDKKKKK